MLQNSCTNWSIVYPMIYTDLQNIPGGQWFLNHQECGKAEMHESHYLRLVVYPISCKFLLHPNWCRISEPSTVGCYNPYIIQACRFGPESSHQTSDSPIFRCGLVPSERACFRTCTRDKSATLMLKPHSAAALTSLICSRRSSSFLDICRTEMPTPGLHIFPPKPLFSIYPAAFILHTVDSLK